MRYRLGLTLLATLAPVSSALAAGGEEGGGVSLISPQFGLMFWTLLTFLILAFFLGKFAWRPLLGAMQERERSIESSLKKAQDDREQAEKLLGEHKQLIAQAHRERAGAIDAARGEAEKLKAEILEEGRKQREHLLRQTQEQVDASLRQARDELRGEVVDLAIRAAEKLVTKNLDDPTQRKLVEDYLSDLDGRAGRSSDLPS